MSVPVLSRLFDVQELPRPSEGSGQPTSREAYEPSSPHIVTRTPAPNPQSQSFSRGYGSILPTSLTYIVLSTRGCSPWRPAAVMSTNRRENHSFPRIFKGLQERTGHHMKCGALPAIKPYLLAIRFHGVRPLTRKENSSQGSCRRLRVQLRYRTSKPRRGRISTFWFGNFNPIPFRSMVQDWTL